MRKQDDLQAAAKSHGHNMDKKNYHKPVLSKYDDLRTVTLGNSPGAKESGNGGPLKRAGFDPPDPPGEGSGPDPSDFYGG